MTKKLRYNRVVFVTATLAHYRAPFHELVRERLHEMGVDYKLIYGQPGSADSEKHDCVELQWATKIENRYGVLLAKSLTWQPLFREIRGGDFVILGQENRLLANYVLQSLRRILPIRVALWGHGRNFQSEAPHGTAERWKQFWALQSDWWFTYTEETADLIESYGFPRKKITTFYNAIDITELRILGDSITRIDVEKLRSNLGSSTNNVGVYVGGIYQQKRIQFLIEACLAVRREIPDFELFIVGGGVDRLIVEEAASRYSWIRYFGPKFGREKVEILKLGRVFLMPGLVGLGVLDCFALGIPMVTTAYPFHSPEAAYLQNGINGVVVTEWDNTEKYSRAIVKCLSDSDFHEKITAGALESGLRYTIENMAERFVEGAVNALSFHN